MGTKGISHASDSVEIAKFTTINLFSTALDTCRYGISQYQNKCDEHAITLRKSNKQSEISRTHALAWVITQLATINRKIII